MSKLIKTIFFLFLFTLIFNFNLIAAERIVLAENFTSTTCPPCAPANQYFDNWLRGYQDGHRVAVIKYHVWWPSPGNDPFYLANTADVVTRRTYYATSAVPWMYINGNINGGSTYSNWPTLISGQLPISSPFNISIDGTISATTGGTLTINVTSDGTPIPSGTLVLHVVIVESELYYTGPNGDPVHNFVMRKMYPSANGETFTINLNDTKTFIRNISWNQDWNIRNSDVIAFVQINETKQVLQAAKRTVITSVQENNNLPSYFTLHQNYPNPFNPVTQIKFSIPHNSQVTLKIFDILGKEITTLVNEELKSGIYEIDFNGSNLTSGVYYYRLDAVTTNNPTNTFTDIRKMILMK